MQVKLPELVVQREQHWSSPAFVAPLEVRQELADWAWEKWAAGQMDIVIPEPLKSDMLNLKQIKEAIHPEPPSKIEEEFQEVIDAKGWADKDASARGLYRDMRNPRFDRSNWERLQYMLNIPSEPIEPYFQYAILKLEGRLEANKANPKANSKEIKYALRDYEDAAAKRVFDAMA